MSVLLPYDPDRDRRCPFADDGEHVWVHEAVWRCRPCGIERDFGAWGPPDDPAAAAGADGTV